MHGVTALASHYTGLADGGIPSQYGVGMSTALERLAGEQYLLLTTFRKSGEPVSTPVWAGQDGDEITVWTERQAGKVKRIRNDPRVELTACDLRGKSTHGPTVSGTARELDDEGSRRVRDSLAQKYGIIGRITMFFSRLRGGKQRTVGLSIALDS